MSGTARKLIAAAAGVGGEVADDDFQSVVLLTNTDGQNNGTNYTFSDSSTNNYTVTHLGDTYQGASSPYNPFWSTWFDGDNDYIRFPASSDFNFGSNDWTMECWIFTDFDDDYGGAVFQWWSSSNYINFKQQGQETYFFQVISGGSTQINVSLDNISFGEWHHFAFVSNGGTFTAYVDGTSVATDTSYTMPTLTTVDLKLGIDEFGADDWWGGWLSDLRIVNGTAVYTSNFTPPTEPLGLVGGSNTKLLTCNRPYNEDVSGNSREINIVGQPNTSPFSPYKSGDPDLIRTATSGGSALFWSSSAEARVGSGSTVLGSGDFTVEFWLRNRDTSGNIANPLTSTGSGYWGLFIQGSDLRWNNSYNVANLWEVDGARLLKADWVHVAVVRSSNTFKVFYNGIQQTTLDSGTFSDSTNYSGSDSLRISEGNLDDLWAWISDFRIVKTAVYTSDFTPPTEPLSAQVGEAYTVGTASYTSKSFDAQTQVSNAVGLQFNSDGTKMYVLDGVDSGLHQYSLSTGFDVSTASYDSVLFDLSSQEAGTLEAFNFKPDGTRMYAIGRGNDKVFQYDLSTAFDISTASYVSSSSTLTQEAAPQGLAFNSDGTKAFTVGTSTDTVYEYDLSTAYDATTMSYSGSSFSVNSQDGTPRDLVFNSSGTKMFIMGDQYNNVRQYSLSTAFDISTASYDSVTFGVGGQETAGKGIAWNNDGTAFYVIGSSDDTAYQYSAFTDAEVMLGFQDSEFFDVSGMNNLAGEGNVKLSTAVTKYSDASLVFDGNGDYVQAYNAYGSTFSDTYNPMVFNGPFTVECWFYQTADAGTGTGQHCIFSVWRNNGDKAYYVGVSGAGGDIQVYLSNDGTTNNWSSSYGAGINNNQWYHIALAWDGTTYRVFLDGTAILTRSSATDMFQADQPFTIGSSGSGSSGALSTWFQGYIEQVRASKGVCRYTSDFTPPSAAFPKY